MSCTGHRRSDQLGGETVVEPDDDSDEMQGKSVNVGEKRQALVDMRGDFLRLR